MSNFKRLREKRIESGSGRSSQVVEITQQIRNAATDRIPDDVWHVLQENGREAAHLLADQLKPHNFNSLAPKDKRALISLALERAYGKADPGIKRSVQVQLSASGNDAVAASLARLSDAMTLPEYANARQTSPDTDETDENDPDHLPDHLDP